MNTAPPLVSSCFHCGDDCNGTAIAAGDKFFCCNGCKTVFQLLHEHDLDHYYCLNESPGKTVTDVSPTKFQFLDEAGIAGKLLSFSSPEQNQVSFHLPQIHCSSCLWLLENLPSMNPAVISSRVNFPAKTVHIAYQPANISLRQLAELLTAMGYEPHISMQDADAAPQSFTVRKAACKLGITGFCFANIMLISFPEYLGLGGTGDRLLVSFFRYINLALSLPVVFYGAGEFFTNAMHSFRQRYVNIDAPIALAIAITFARSCRDILHGTGGGYLDSMSGIVFFMLIGRTLQNRVYYALRFDRDYKSFLPIAVTVLKDQEEQICPVQDIRKNDLILLHHQEILPVDCLLSKGKALIDYSFITGETAATVVQTGELLYAGGKVQGAGITVVAIAPFSQSGFTQLWNNKAFAKTGNGRATMSNTISRYFSVVLFAIALLAFGYWQYHDPARAWHVLTSILIVACPCSLLLSTTFTYGYITAIFSRSGCFVKNAQTIERLAGTSHIVFDKTGTLTEVAQLPVKIVVIEWTPEEKDIALSLMAQSVHPLSRAIVQHFGRYEKRRITHFREVAGMGIEAYNDDRHIKIGSSRFIGNGDTSSDESEVLVWIDGQTKARFQVVNRVKPGMNKLLQGLSGFRLSLLSGDHERYRKQMEALMPTGASIHFQQTPQLKLDYIQQLQEQGERVLMVGDGLNDAGALQQADTGIAIVADTCSFPPACDAVLEAKQLHRLHDFILVARRAVRLIIAGFIYSVLYNIAGLYFAATAQLTPMVAAILMPLSSIGIVGITALGSRYIGMRLRKKTDENHIYG